jgi:ectoine hydroxylase-related dioxygenase (phytanoyl-CoA dioxygenase family)
MAEPLSDDRRQAYREDGIVFPLAVLSDQEVQRYRSACDELEAQLGGKPRTIDARQMHLHLRWAWELATRPSLLDAVEGLLGPDLLVWATELFAKHPHDPTVSVAWHRDEPYLGVAPECAVTAWLALSPSGPGNGGMRFVPRSRELAGAPPEEQEQHDVVLRPGEASLHDALLLHGSGANFSAEKRVGFVVRFLAPQARPRAGRPPVLVARGRCSPDHFTVVAPPAPGAAALGGLRKSATEHLDVVLENLRQARLSSQVEPLR